MNRVIQQSDDCLRSSPQNPNEEVIYANGKNGDDNEGFLVEYGVLLNVAAVSS